MKGWRAHPGDHPTTACSSRSAPGSASQPRGPLDRREVGRWSLHLGFQARPAAQCGVDIVGNVLDPATGHGRSVRPDRRSHMWNGAKGCRYRYVRHCHPGAVYRWLRTLTSDRSRNARLSALTMVRSNALAVAAMIRSWAPRGIPWVRTSARSAACASATSRS